MRTSALELLALTGLLAWGSARAADPLGLYLGGSIGEADVRARLPPDNIAVDQHHVGWSAFAGVRPISLLGAEIQYIDFSRQDVTSSSLSGNSSVISTETGDLYQRAVAVSGLLYAPLPLPLLDIYGRLGVARLQSSGSGGIGYRCDPNLPCPAIVFPYTPRTPFSVSDTAVVYGAGAQVTVKAFAVRLEYERISAGSRSPDLLSLGLAVMF